jgi:hypothetical protein
MVLPLHNQRCRIGDKVDSIAPSAIRLSVQELELISIAAIIFVVALGCVALQAISM